VGNKRCLKVALLVFILSTTNCLAAGNTYYVDDDSPADYNSIQAAINDANDGDTIIVAFGKYFEHLNTLGKAITLKSTDLSDPNVTSLPIITGGTRGSCITCNSGEDANTIIQGFYITCGDGYGIDCNSTSPTIKNCKFTNTYYQDVYYAPQVKYEDFTGLYCYDSNSVITDCVFMSNDNGAISCQSSNLQIQNSTFIANGSGYDSGAVRSVFSNLKVTDCIFNNNSDGGLFFYCLNGHNNLEITSCQFIANYSDYHGGAIYSSYCDSNSKIEDCSFIANSTDSGYRGGAIYSYGGIAPTITNSKFNGNSARYGGAVTVDNSHATINKSIFAGNSAFVWGGAIHNRGNSVLTVTDCTITENSVGGSSDIYAGAIFNQDGSILTITNSIICNNSPEQIEGDFIDNGDNQIGLICPPGILRGFYPSDTNGDLKVNFIDFAILAENWLKSTN